MFYYNNNRVEFESAINNEFKTPSIIKKYISNIQVRIDKSNTSIHEPHPIKKCDILFSLKDHVLHRKDTYIEILSALGQSRYYFYEHAITEDNPAPITRCRLECSNRAKLFSVAALFVQQLEQDPTVEIHSIILELAVLETDERVRYNYYESRPFHLMQLLITSPDIRGDIFHDTNINTGYEALLFFFLCADLKSRRHAIKIKMSNISKEEAIKLADNISNRFRDGGMYVTPGRIYELMELTNDTR